MALYVPDSFIAWIDDEAHQPWGSFAVVHLQDFGEETRAMLSKCIATGRLEVLRPVSLTMADGQAIFPYLAIPRHSASDVNGEVEALNKALRQEDLPTGQARYLALQGRPPGLEPLPLPAAASTRKRRFTEKLRRPVVKDMEGLEPPAVCENVEGFRDRVESVAVGMETLMEPLKTLDASIALYEKKEDEFNTSICEAHANEVEMRRRWMTYDSVDLYQFLPWNNEAELKAFLKPDAQAQTRRSSLYRYLVARTRNQYLADCVHAIFASCFSKTYMARLYWPTYRQIPAGMEEIPQLFMLFLYDLLDRVCRYANFKPDAFSDRAKNYLKEQRAHANRKHTAESSEQED